MVKKLWYIPLGVVFTLLALYFAQMFVSWVCIDDTWFTVLAIIMVVVSLFLVLFNIRRV